MAVASGNSNLFARTGLVLIGLAWTLPFLQPYHRYPITAFYSEWLAFALGLAAMLLLFDRASWQGRALPAVALAPIGLAGVVIAQGTLGRLPYPEQQLTVVLYLLWAALMILLGRVVRQALAPAGVAATLAWFLVGGGMASATVGLLQHFEVAFPLDFLVARKSTLQVYGNLGQSNHYAAYLALALASLGYLYGVNRLRAATVAGCAAPCLLALALSGSRSAWLYLGAFALLALWLDRVRRDDGSRRLVLHAGGLLAGFVVAQGAAVLAPQGQWVTSGERLFQLADGIAPRLQLWGEAWSLFLSAPLLGAGFGQFAWHHFVAQAAAGVADADGLYNHAHNLVFHLLAEFGLIGASAILGGLALWAADLRRAAFDLERWWLLAVLVVIGIHSLLEYPLWYSYFLGMAAFAIGFGAERAFAPRWVGAARFTAGVAVVAGWLNLTAMIGPYREFERLVFLPEAAAPRPADGEAFARAIVALYREPLLVPYVELAIAFGLVVDEKGLPEKLALAGRAVRFAPVSVVTYRHALLLALAGERDAARAQLERALRVYPGEAAEITAQLEGLARRWPGQFTPLLEWAATRSAAPRVANP